MKIYLKEISEEGMELDFTQAEPWVSKAVCQVDEPSEESSSKSTPRPTQVHLALRKVDEVYIISGKLDTFVELACSRCATLFKHYCNPNFSALFCNDPALAGIAHLQRQGTDSRAPGKPTGQNHGHARHAHDESGNEDGDSMSESKDVDITYLSHDFIDLSDVISEQLQLQVPFQPLCEVTCKGICSQCGVDLNQGHCTCAPLIPRNPFSILKDYKV